EISNELFIAKADSAWHSIERVSVIKEFAEFPYRAGIYLYAPSVGVFEPSVAKWIIFLYYGKLSTDVSTTTMPNSFQLFQNYPNPFNTNTRISYLLSHGLNVELKVYNLLGNEIATLVNKYQNKGYYYVDFDISDSEIGQIPSGIYFYKLKAGNFIQSRKMVYVK
ncbi:T9SS type A sorting domain-containing protein, partial [Bacteroidota bacterium]